MGRKDRGGGDTTRGLKTVTKRRERWLKGGFKAIFPVPVRSNLTCEVPMPPLGDPWDRYDP